MSWWWKWPNPPKEFNPEAVHKVWGSYVVLEQGDKYKVKVLEINPNHSISHQHHLYRDEIWVVVKGRLILFLDGKVKELNPGSRVFIPTNSIHGVDNKGVTLAKVIEIQYGSYVGEDDIVRHTISK